MPSLLAICIKEQIRLIKPIKDKMSIETARGAQDKLGRLGRKMAGTRVTAERGQLAGVETAFVRANHPDAGHRVLLYLHGGGYVAGNLDYALGFGSLLAERLRLDVYCAAYRLAPEHPFPAALEDAFAAYSHLLELGYAPEEITLIGESAGGGLVFCLALLLKEKGMPQPCSLVAISPWTDLAMRGASYRDNQRCDPSLNIQQLHEYAACYAASADLENPLISPLYGDLSGLPRSLIIVGGDELLLDDARMMHERLRAAGCAAELLAEDYMWHVYVLYGTPEADQAMSRIAAFLGVCDEGTRRA